MNPPAAILFPFGYNTPGSLLATMPVFRTREVDFHGKIPPRAQSFKKKKKRERERERKKEKTRKEASA